MSFRLGIFTDISPSHMPPLHPASNRTSKDDGAHHQSKRRSDEPEEVIVKMHCFAPYSTRPPTNSNVRTMLNKKRHAKLSNGTDMNFIAHARTPLIFALIYRALNMAQRQSESPLDLLINATYDSQYRELML